MESALPPPDEPKAPRKKPQSSKKTTVNVPSPSTQKAKPVAAPPSPVVAQLMEMGFDRKRIEFAIQTTSSNSPERLINWLVDHSGMEIPEVEPPRSPLPSTPPTAKEQRSASSSSSYGSSGIMFSESSSDSSDYSGEGVVEVEEVEEGKSDYVQVINKPCDGGVVNLDCDGGVVNLDR